VRLTSKGQVTIPQEIRERLGLLPQSEVEFEIDGDSVRIRKARKRAARGEARARALFRTSSSALMPPSRATRC
jgi:AbrB family looped-hinge helix DNA binding protein